MFDKKEHQTKEEKADHRTDKSVPDEKAGYRTDKSVPDEKADHHTDKSVPDEKQVAKDTTNVEIPVGKKCTVKLTGDLKIERPHWSVESGDVRIEVAADRQSADIVVEKSASPATILVEGTSAGFVKKHRIRVNTAVAEKTESHIEVHVSSPSNYEPPKKEKNHEN